MHDSYRVPRRALAIVTGAVLATAVVAGLSMAAGGGPVSAAKKVTVKCPADVAGGGKVKCKLKGKLPKGPKGAPGAAGAPGLSGYEVVDETFTDVFALNSGGQRGLSDVKTVSCPSGKRAIGGGVDLGTNATENGDQRQMILSASFPSPTGGGWNVQLFNNSTSIDNALDVKAYAICAAVA